MNTSVLWVSFAIFLVHRFLTFNLFQALPVWSSPRILLLGISSDFIISFILAILFYFITFFLKTRIRDTFATLLVVFVLFFTAIHQEYAAFFNHHFLPYHFNYLFDKEFLQTCSLEGLSFQFYLTIFLGITTLFLVRWRSFQSGKSANIIFLILIFSISLKWTFKSNENINNYNSFNYIESTLYSIFSSLNNGSKKIYSKRTLHEILFKNKEKLSPIEQKIKNEFDLSISKGQHPLVITILMESGRWLDFGVYHNLTKESLTPNFDEFSKSSILFENAYSTGNVTRGAQEAVFCGFLGNIHTSMMRKKKYHTWKCLPDYIKGNGLAWYHGGNGKFDNQVLFWENKGVERIITELDFPPQLPKTSWGYGDISFFNKLNFEFFESIKQGNYTFVLGLTSTNHAPWDLPSDATFDVNALPHSSMDGMWATTKYSDIGLGKWLAELKTSKLWENSIILIMGDHGVVGHNHYSDLNRGRADNQSHIAMALGGGLIEKALISSGVENLTVTNFVDQSQAFPFFMNLIGNEEEVISHSLLVEKKDSSVIVDLGDILYSPVDNKIWNRSNAFNSNNKHIGLLKYMAFDQYINLAELSPLELPKNGIINFGKNGNSKQYISGGWSTQEDKFIWTDRDKGERAFVAFKQPKQGGKLRVSFKIIPNNQPTLNIYCNTSFLERKLITARTEFYVNLPESCFREGVVTLGLIVDDASSPSLSDPRILGVAVESVQIHFLSK